MDLRPQNSNWQTAISATDTVWGLVAKPNEKNYKKIYEIKSRSKSKPLILFVRNKNVFWKYCKQKHPELESLINTNWPGALTIIIPRSKLLPNWLNPDLDSIAFREPDSASIKKLFDSCSEEFLLSTSANYSSKEPVENFQEALDQFGNKVDLILEPESSELSSNKASTIIQITDLKQKKLNYKILRQGSCLKAS